MNHLFISYSRQDEVIVDRFAAALREKGYQIWQDKSGAGTGIPFSTKWFDIITEALYSAQGAIIFRSENWERSTPCKNEFAVKVSLLGTDPGENSRPDGILLRLGRASYSLVTTREVYHASFCLSRQGFAP